jgi:hypothetical protein
MFCSAFGVHPLRYIMQQTGVHARHATATNACATDTGYFAVFSFALVDVPFLMKVVAAWH